MRDDGPGRRRREQARARSRRPPRLRRARGGCGARARGERGDAGPARAQRRAASRGAVRQSAHGRQGRARQEALFRHAPLDRRHRRLRHAATIRATASPTRAASRPPPAWAARSARATRRPSLNAAFLASQFWDGRAATLEAQAVLPLINPIEHGFANQAGRAREAEDASANTRRSSRRRSGAAEISSQRVGQAIASFERTLLSLDAPIDRFLAGDSKAISASAQRGWELFNAKARCNTCHGRIDVLPLFTDDLFHNIGVGVKQIDFPAVARKSGGGRGGREVHRRARPRQRRGQRARALPGDPRAEGPRRLQDAAAPQRRAHRPLHARRQRGDAARRDRVLRPRRRATTRISTEACVRWP